MDDDHWIRTGRAAALSTVPGIKVVSEVDPGHALRHSSTLWDDVDVALVDAYDQEAGFDRFPGAAVVKAIRAHPRGSQIGVVVITGHVANDMLRIRMAEAGADLFYGHSEIASPADLLGIIERAAHIAGATGRLKTLRSAVMQRPDAAVEWVGQRGHQLAFEGGPQKTLPVSRRTILTIRKHVGAYMNDKSDPGGPSWRRVSDFINRARGADIGPK